MVTRLCLIERTFDKVKYHNIKLRELPIKYKLAT